MTFPEHYSTERRGYPAIASIPGKTDRLGSVHVISIDSKSYCCHK